MKKILRFTAGIISFLWLWSHGNAQVLVKASVDRNRILIGEHITLQLDLRVPLGEKIGWFNYDSIPHFTLIDSTKIYAEDGVDGKKMQQQWMVTGFDTGHWVIPPLPVKVGKKTYYSDTLGIDVLYADFDSSADYRDIKPLIAVLKPPADYLPWVLGGFTLLAAGAIAWLLVRNGKRKKVPVVAPLLSPYDEAIQALSDLRKQQWSNAEEVKEYYTRLNNILRVFIHRKLGISTLERTNEELVLKLQQYNLPRSIFTELAQALRLADFVKFARYQPGIADHDKSFEVVTSSIKLLNNLTENLVV